MQVQIKFKRTGSNSVYGSFATGDIIRCDAALAKHYVDSGNAVYTEPAQPPVEVAAVVPVIDKPKKATKNVPHANKRASN